MRAVIQRVTQARVLVDGALTGQISGGLVVLVAVAYDDTEADATYLAGKIAGLRVFPDAEGKMNLDVKQAGGGLLIVSNFTLYGDTRKGKRPSFEQAARPESAKALYEYFSRCGGRFWNTSCVGRVPGSHDRSD